MLLMASTIRTSPLAMIRRPAMVAGTVAAGVGAGSPLDWARAGVWPGGMASTSSGRPMCSSQWPRNCPGRWLSVRKPWDERTSRGGRVRRSWRASRSPGACPSTGASSCSLCVSGVRKQPAAARGVPRVLASGNDRGWFGSSAKTGAATRHEGRGGHCGCGGGGRAGACGPAIDACRPLIGGGRWMWRRPGMNGRCRRGQWRPVWVRGNRGAKAQGLGQVSDQCTQRFSAFPHHRYWTSTSSCVRRKSLGARVAWLRVCSSWGLISRCGPIGYSAPRRRSSCRS